MKKNLNSGLIAAFFGGLLLVFLALVACSNPVIGRTPLAAGSPDHSPASTAEASPDSSPTPISSPSPTTPTPSPSAFTCSLQSPAPGLGTVSLSPQKSSYTSNEEITVSAVPSESQLFTGWEEAGNLVSTATPYTFTISGNRAFTATFKPKPHVTFAVTPVGSGTIDLTNAWHLEGDHLVATATPASNRYAFNHWTRNGSSSNANPIDFVVDNTDETITVVFTAVPAVNPTISFSPAGSGSSTITPAGPYYPGDTIQVSLTPATGYSFSHWTGDVGGNAASQTWTLDTTPAASATMTALTGPASVQATWVPPPQPRADCLVDHYQITASQNGTMVITACAAPNQSSYSMTLEAGTYSLRLDAYYTADAAQVAYTASASFTVTAA